METSEKEMVKNLLKESVNITDDDFELFSQNPESIRLVSHDRILRSYIFTAEVIESKYCSANIKVGQKYTILGLPACILPQETDCPLCIKAIAPMVDIINSFWHEITNGKDPCQSEPRLVGCLDPGIKGGGLGHVVLKIYAKKRN